jgi:hypothetical protein
MFESLADRMREDDHQEVKTSERIIKVLVIIVLSIVLFGGLYLGIRMLE